MRWKRDGLLSGRRTEPKQHEYRDLFRTPFLSCLSCQFTGNQLTEVKPVSYFKKVISARPIHVPTEKANHAVIQKVCPSHKSMGTQFKNDLLYIFAFLKA